MASPTHEDPVEPYVRKLLFDLFNAEEFEVFARDYYREIYPRIKGSVPFQRTDEFVWALSRHGLLDERFFQNLVRERPKKKNEISELEQRVRRHRRAQVLPQMAFRIATILLILAIVAGVLFKIDIDSLRGEKRELVAENHDLQCKNRLAQLELRVLELLELEQAKLSEIVALCRKSQRGTSCKQVEAHVKSISDTRSAIQESLVKIAQSGCTSASVAAIEQRIESEDVQGLLKQASVLREQAVVDLAVTLPAGHSNPSMCPACTIYTCPLPPGREKLEQELGKEYRSACGEWFTPFGHRVVLSFSHDTPRSESIGFSIVEPKSSEIRNCLVPVTRSFLKKHGTEASPLVGKPTLIEIWHK
jgi:hypothetical protein